MFAMRGHSANIPKSGSSHRGSSYKSMIHPEGGKIPGWRTCLAPSLLVASITFLCFLPSLGNGFVHYDDYGCLLDNSLVLDPSWQSLVRIFTEFYISNYQPIVLVVFRFFYAIFGLDAFIFHVFPLLLHTANACLLFYILIRMGIKPWTALISGLVFSIHSLRVEGISWVYAGFNYTICSFFFLAAVLAYLIDLKEGIVGCRRGWTIAVLYCLAVLSKPAAIVLPFALLMLDFLLKRPPSTMLLKEKIPLFILATIFLWIGIMAQQSGGATAVGGEFLMWERPVIALKALAYYLVKTVWPVELSVLVPYPTRQELLLIMSYGDVLLLLTICVSCVLTVGRTRLPLFVMGWYIICIFPALRLVPLGHSLVGDRYTYLPAIGLSIGIGLMLDAFKNLKQRRIWFAVLAATLVYFGRLSWKQSKVWRDDLSLWQHTASVVPDSVLAHTHLGSAYAMAGRLEEAKAEFQIVRKLGPDLPYADFGFGKVYGQAGDFQKAIEHFEHVVRLDPTHKEAYIWLGIAYCGLEDWGNAHRVFQKAIRLGGDVPEQFLQEVLRHVKAN